jgi:hypothetical protein|tara:strand:+ start:263 stop:730 length:468 start_codon:yes stop_codon:yes gene_type:complete
MTIFDQKLTTEKEDTTSPEHYLWTSVLTKAAHDALYSSDWLESRKAIEWFKRKGSNFYKVCEFAGKDPAYVYQKMIEQIMKRESHMESVRNGNRLYVKNNERFNFHSHYRGGRLGKKRGPYNVKPKLRAVSTPRKKDPLAVLRGRKGGRPRLYVV